MLYSVPQADDDFPFTFYYMSPVTKQDTGELEFDIHWRCTYYLTGARCVLLRMNLVPNVIVTQVHRTGFKMGVGC